MHKNTIFGEIIYSKNNIIVIENKGIRSLKFGLRTPAIQGAIDISDPNKIILLYMQIFEELFKEKIGEYKDFLLLGLGTGTACQIIKKHNAEAKIDIVEINSLVIEVAKDYFNFNHGTVNIINSDAIEWVKACEKQYDFIFVDIFLNALPSGLFEETFVKNIAKMSTSKGIGLLNLRGEDEVLNTIFNNFKRAFGAGTVMLELPDDNTNYRNHFLMFGGGQNQSVYNYNHKNF